MCDGDLSTVFFEDSVFSSDRPDLTDYAYAGLVGSTAVPYVCIAYTHFAYFAFHKQ